MPKYLKVKLNIYSTVFCVLIISSIFLTAINNAYAQLDTGAFLVGGQKNLMEAKANLEVARRRLETAEATNIKTVSPGDILALENAVKMAEIAVDEAEKQIAKESGNWLQSFYNAIKEKLWTATGSGVLQTTLTAALRKIAYDTATWVGSGGEGQKPLFVTEDWGTYLGNIADEAAGQFIEEIFRENTYVQFNACKPDIKVVAKIGLGLKQYARPSAPACTFREMTKNWNEEIQKADFLNNFQDMFNPGSNDLGVALTLQGAYIEAQQTKKDLGEKERIASNGWIDIKGLINGDLKSAPGTTERALANAGGFTPERVVQFTGNAFVDAANVFINQLLYELFQKLIRNLGGAHTTEPYDGDYGNVDTAANSDGGTGFGSGSGDSSGSGLYSYEAQTPYKGVKGAQAYLRELTEPSFNSKGDYNIAGELSICQDPAKAGPTGCVITDKFREAITGKISVGDALAKGYLNTSGLFGFNADGLEPKYNEGYPYRSLIILRKYRIIPVGWELAAEYIKDHPSEAPKNIKDMIDCFSSDDGYTGYEKEWCRGLVDPNWVLKAPKNYCRRQGAGPEITTETVTGTGASSELMLTRNDKYCADEQACIKEKDDGSCELYGYCTEERRKWNFGANSCEPKYNTCQTFKSRTGQTASYLENTLDYGNCTIDNVGCKMHATGGWFASSTSSIFVWSATTSPPLYFDKDVKTCANTAEGCHEFIRLRPGLGANLLVNSDFEDDIADTDWTELGAARSPDAYSGLFSLQFSAAGPHRMGVAVAPDSFNVGGEYYTLSFYAKDCAAGDTFVLGNSAAQNLQPSENWMRYEMSYAYPSDYSANEVFITFHTASCLIDAVKLEAGNTATKYSLYGAFGAVYQKLMPAYLAPYCIGSSTDPVACAKFVKRCSSDEAGCEMYTRAKDDMRIPAKIKAEDYCPAECLDYDTYVQSETSFDSRRDSYFIPQSAEICSASEAGCDEFTNLDKISTTTANSAEAKEYYSYLRQCIKPSEPGASCAEFYTWEGSDETGYQLKVFTLQSDGAAGPNQEPHDLDYDPAKCSPDLYNTLKPGDPDYNPECREFYNKQGGVSYHLLRNTVSCTTNCYPYRRTEINIDPSILTQNDCNNLNTGLSAVSNWDAVHSECRVCKNGGLWNTQHNACIYQAVPNEGLACSADKNGCREYRGNTGANKRTVSFTDFEGQMDGWSATGTPAIVTMSNVALLAGGHSLSIAGGDRHIAKNIGGYNATEGKAYVLSFSARASTTARFTAMNIFDSATGSPFNIFGIADLTADWRMYTVNILSLHRPAVDEYLSIRADGDFYIDDIKLTEITDQFYLIKNSWNTPASCDQDPEGNPHPLFMLGCSAYSDRDNISHNLHSFSSLCREDAVGCEMMIDTFNSTSAASSTVEGVLTPADRFAYVVYDAKKKCSQADKGCSRYGLANYTYGNSIAYKDSYLKNDPDMHEQILCARGAAGCESWTSPGGDSYFKSPGDMVCEWRQMAGSSANSQSWLKKRIKFCDNNRNTVFDYADTACQADADCAPGISCSEDKYFNDASNNGSFDAGETVYQSLAACRAITANICVTFSYPDQLCPVSDLKTFGRGGQGGAVDQPSIDSSNNYWAGLCPAAESGCREYIDPISKFNANLIFNGDFKNIDGIGGGTDGWEIIAGEARQYFKVEPNTLYRLAADRCHGTNNNELRVECEDWNFYTLNSSNNIVPAGNTGLAMPLDSNHTVSRQFYLTFNQTASSCAAYIDSTAAVAGCKVEIKKSAIDYQLANKIDLKTCNGIVDFEKGCVLFNERRQDGRALAGFAWDADRTIIDGNGMPPATIPNGSAEGDSNQLIKVSPDRVCDKWLACRSYAKDEKGENVCFDIGLCDSVDENGNCSNFLFPSQENQSYRIDGTHGNITGDEIINLTGYSKAGNSGGSIKTDLYPLAAMSQAGDVAGGSSNIPNGNFEFYGSNFFPIGWSELGTSTAGWDGSKYSVINNPISAQADGIKYPAEGRAFLRLGDKYPLYSEIIDVTPDTEYVISALVNTINLKGADEHKTFFAIDMTAPASADNCSQSGGDLPGFQRIDTSQGIELGTTGMCDGSGCRHYYAPPVEMGNDWTRITGKFRTLAGITKVRITLLNGDRNGNSANAVCITGEDLNKCQGNTYVDDIKIMPALKAKDNKFVSQTCRLYPETDALSCDYYDDAGKRQRGQFGYCLEYDRAPGSPDACLLWWPVDKVKGSGIEEGAGYSSKYPAYYCLEAVPYCSAAGQGWYCAKVVQTVTTSGQNKYWAGRVKKGSSYEAIPNISDKQVVISYRDDLVIQQLEVPPTIATPIQGFICPNPLNYIDCDAVYCTCQLETTGTDGACHNANCGGFPCASLMDSTGWRYICYDPTYAATLTPGSPGSPGFIIPTSTIANGVYSNDVVSLNYPRNSTPYGSINPPYPPTNPYEWDTRSNSEDNLSIEPLEYFKPGSDLSQANMGTAYYGTATSCSYVSNIDVIAGSAGTLGSTNEESIQCRCDNSGHPGGTAGQRVSGQGCIAVTRENSIGYTECAVRCPDGYVALNYAGCNNNNGPGVGCGNWTTAFDENGDNGCHAATDLFDRNAWCSMTCIRTTATPPTPGTPTIIKTTTRYIDMNYNLASSLDTARTALQNIFAQSYGVWSWNNPGRGDGRYVKDECSELNWSVPAPCPANSSGIIVRPSAPTSANCSVPPRVGNIRVNNNPGSVSVVQSQFMNLTFNSLVDSEQIPLTMYKVDWGDGGQTSVSGVEMSDRQNEDKPHSLFHLYSYWDVRSRSAAGLIGGCADAGGTITADLGEETRTYTCPPNTACCAVIPRVVIKDNWGWCSGDTSLANLGRCNHMTAFGGWVVLTSGRRIDLPGPPAQTDVCINEDLHPGIQRTIPIGYYEYPLGSRNCLPIPNPCGNGDCDPGSEDCESCPADCGACCGNGSCDHGETSATCLVDCPVTCNTGCVGDGTDQCLCPGLSASYYDYADFFTGPGGDAPCDTDPNLPDTNPPVSYSGSEPTYYRVDPIIDLNWGPGDTGPFAAMPNGDTWTATWTGYLYVPADGTYTFGLTSDDFTNFSIDNQAVYVDRSNFYDWDPSIYPSAPVSLTAGYHSINMNYAQACYGGSYIHLYWDNGGSFNIIPAGNWWHNQ